jgi:16S rRNA (uracil1498-N3)-methyltransferase
MVDSAAPSRPPGNGSATSVTPAHVAATAHVFVERLDDRITLDGDDGHHLQRARRVRAGETVTAADGYGRWRVFTVTAAEKGRVELQALTDLAHEPRLTPRLTVACSLTKGEKPELVVQKLTELGVDRILLVAAARSVVRWDDDKVGAAIERLQRVAREAGAQSRRARVPVVDGPVAATEVAAMPGLIVATVDGVAAAELAVPPGGEWVVVVGPEGGFDSSEDAAFGHAPRLAVGPFVLRAETAAIAVSAALAGRRTFLSDEFDRREW